MEYAVVIIFHTAKFEKITSGIWAFVNVQIEDQVAERGLEHYRHFEQFVYTCSKILRIMDLETAEKLMDGKAKPPGSLGALEFWAAQLCAIQGTKTPSLEYASLLIFAGDHGVTAEGVASFPPSVTAAIFATIASGKAASSVIAASQGIELEVIDVGIASDVSKFYNDIAINCKVMHTNSEMTNEMYCMEQDNGTRFIPQQDDSRFLQQRKHVAHHTNAPCQGDRRTATALVLVLAPFSHPDLEPSANSCSLRIAQYPLRRCGRGRTT